LPCRIIDMEMSMNGEVLHEERHVCCQTDRTKEGAGCPDGDECLLYQRAIPGDWTVTVNTLRRIGHRMQSPRRYR